MPTDSAAQALHVDPIPEAPFYIAVADAAARARHTLKSGDTFVVMDSHGDVGASPGGQDGLFHRDTRYLSRLELTVNERQPLLLGSSLRDDNALLAIDLTNPDIFSDQRIVLQKDTLHIVRTTFLWNGTAYQRIAVRNFGDRPVDLRLLIRFDSDFADLFEVRGIHRDRRGVATRMLSGSDQALLSYQGLDGTTRRTRITFDPPPTRLTANAASYHPQIAPGEVQSIFVAVACDRAEVGPAEFDSRAALFVAHGALQFAVDGARHLRCAVVPVIVHQVEELLVTIFLASRRQ